MSQHDLGGASGDSGQLHLASRRSLCQFFIAVLCLASGTAFAQAVQEQFEGVVEVLHEDRDVGSRYRYFLHTKDERLELRFGAEAPELKTGARVRARGVRSRGVLSLSSKSSVATLSQALPNTFGPQKTLIILVNFQNNPVQPFTVAYAQNVAATTSNFDQENSYQQAWLDAAVVGWYTIPQDSTVCNYPVTGSLAEQAASAAGIDLSAYSRRVYAFPRNACTWWGLGSVGGNPSRAWINGNFALKVLGHEMGHNLGLFHSHSLDCGTVVLGSNCIVYDYGDTIDIMGNNGAGHYNAFQKELLGWLDYGASPPINAVETDGVYWIAPFESLSGDAKALKILKSVDGSTGKRTYYYVEFRQAMGFDRFLSTYANVLSGVVIHMGSESSGNTSNLLDLTPATSSWFDPALVAGQSYSDSAAGVTITVLSVNSSGASVSVTFSAATCVRASPKVALSPSSQWVRTGTTATYTVTVTNNDGASCGASVFGLNATLPAGWTGSFGALPTIAPGGSASTTFQATSPATSPDGLYTIPVSATNTVDNAYGSSTTVQEMSLTQLTVRAATDKTVYARNTYASIMASVRVGESPVAGAGVLVSIMRSGSLVARLIGNTDTAGNVVLKYRIAPTAATGAYQVITNAAMNGFTGSAATLTFTVQ